MPSKNPAQRLRDILDTSMPLRFSPPALIHRHPEIDWPAVAAAGNLYRHEYESVDEVLIWHTVRHDLDTLRGVAAAELDRARLQP